jgi:hypothetical protein
VTAALAHVPASHTVPATWLRQAPLPSQVPSRPQVDASDAGQSVGCRGALPAGTTVQIPGDPWTSQARQVSLHEVLQQMPSAQKPLWQSLVQAQASPFGRAAPASAMQLTVIVSSDPSRPASGRLLDDPPQPTTPRASSSATAATRACALVDELLPSTPGE